VKLHVVMAAFLLCSPLLLAGCTDSQAAYKSQDYSYDRRDAFKADMNQALDKLESKLENLREKAEKGGANVKDSALMAETKEALVRMRQSLSDVGNTTKENWNDFTSNFSRTMGDLGGKIEDAFDR